VQAPGTDVFRAIVHLRCEVRDSLDGALRQGRYTPSLWKQHTGTELPALWDAYVAAQAAAAAARKA